MKNQVFIVCFISLINNLTLLGTPEEKQSTEPKKQEASTGKLLKKPQMALLNKVFEERPMAVVRTRVASANAVKTQKAIEILVKAQPPKDRSGKVMYFATEAEESAFIAGNLKLLIDPIRKFFEEVHQYGHLITPIITESLGNNSKNSFLIKFFQTKSDIGAFFEKEVKSVEDLNCACEEFHTVFSDVFASLSEKARKEYERVMDIIKKSQVSKKPATT